MTWKRKTCGAAHLKSPSWYLPKACRMMVMTAMMGLTTQNWRVAWRTHYNSEWDIQKKKKSRTPWRRRRMRDDEGRQNLFVHSHCSLTVSLNHFYLWSFLIITITAILMWKWTHEHRIHTIVKTCRCSEQIANLTYESLLHDSSWYKHLYTLFIQTLVRLSCILL